MAAGSDMERRAVAGKPLSLSLSLSLALKHLHGGGGDLVR